FWDVKGRRYEASPDTLVGVLRAWGMPIEGMGDVDAAWTWFHERAAATVIEPVHVVWANGPLWVRLRLPPPMPARARATLLTESGVGIDLGAIDLDPESVDHGPITTHDAWFSVETEWPLGYHQLLLEVGGRRWESTVIVA